MQNDTFFYILSAILIITSILSIISEKIVLSMSAIICFLYTVGILFIGLNSFICGIFQVIATLFLLILFKILYKNQNKQKQNESLFRTKRFWAGICTVILLIISAGFFIYYYVNYTARENLLIYSDKAVILPSLSALISAKSIFVDYCLAYFYVVLIFVIAIGGISLLIKRKPKGDESD